jgi:hypothetical protein
MDRHALANRLLDSDELVVVIKRPQVIATDHETFGLLGLGSFALRVLTRHDARNYNPTPFAFSAA